MHPYSFTLLKLFKHRPVKAIQIAWWWLTKRRVRALGQLRSAAAAIPDNYRLWLHFHEAGMSADALTINASELTQIAVHLHVPRAGITNGDFQAAVRSLFRQTLTCWRLYVTASDESAASLFTAFPDDSRIVNVSGTFSDQETAFSYVVAIADERYLIPLAAGCRLTPGAVLAFAKAAEEARANEFDSKVLYADQDEAGGDDRRSNPWLKPGWDVDLFLAQDYISNSCALPIAAARQAIDEGAYGVAAVVAQILLKPGAPGPQHVAYVAVTTPPGRWMAYDHTRGAVIQTITGLPVSQGQFGTLIVHRPLPYPFPLVSIVVPTRDRLDLLATCVDGVLHRTDYPAIELLIADNQSVESETLNYLESITRDPRVKVIRWPFPYNYSAINNFAVAQATGAYICLLNNDTEVIRPDWLQEMMAHAVRSDVGAVGARLLYPDASIQHAGVVIGMGNAAGHAHRGLPKGKPGWFAQALVTREATAVTAACLVVAKQKFDAVKGLDEDNLAIAYNDVDLCLKLRAAGWRNIYAAGAVLIHHESKSRGLDLSPEHLARYMCELRVLQERWKTPGFPDTTHHPGLDPSSEFYQLKL